MSILNDQCDPLIACTVMSQNAQVDTLYSLKISNHIDFTVEFSIWHGL